MDAGLLSTLVGAALAVGSAAMSWCFHLNNSHVRTCAQFEATQRTVEQNNARISNHNAQLASLETTVIGLNRAQSLADERHREITGKLDILPKLEATLEAVGKACEQIVPRYEIDQRFEATARLVQQVGVSHVSAKSNQRREE